MISDATYYAQQLAALKAVSAKEIDVLEETIAAEEAFKKKAEKPADRLNIETKILQDRAAWVRPQPQSAATHFADGQDADV